MINIRESIIGDKQAIRQLQAAPSVLEDHLVKRMAEVGQEIVDTARSLVPVRRGALRDAIRWKVEMPKGHLRLEVKPSGKGARHAHLVERGVQGHEIKVHKNIARARRIKWKNGKLRKGGEYWIKSESFYTRWHAVKAVPYFGPAVESVGDVHARLQGAVRDASAETARLDAIYEAK